MHPVMRVVIVTMDSHLASAAERASRTLARAMPGLKLVVHAAAEWGSDPAALERCNGALAVATIEIPGALPDHGCFWSVVTEWLLSHELSLTNTGLVGWAKAHAPCPPSRVCS